MSRLKFLGNYLFSIFVTLGIYIFNLCLLKGLPSLNKHTMNSSDSDDSGSDISVSPELPPQKKLLDRIVESYCLSKSNGRDERFFPNNALSRLVTEDTIITELSSGKFRIDDIYTERRDRDEFVEWILKEAPKLFLICVRVKLSPKRIFESLTRFKERRFTDQELPIQDLESEDCQFREHFIPSCRTLSFFSDFFEEQWKFLSPFFKDTPGDYSLHARHILPFIEKDSQSKTGAFSSVFKVTIHEAHRHPTIGQVALKEIQTSHDSAPEHRQGITTGEVWEVEARALSMVNVLEHDHIVRCIATIRKGDKRYFMFPWASGGSLREFWEENHKPDLTKDLVREVLSELRGLADGLRRLHIYEPEQFSQAEDQSDSNLPEAYSENINNAEIPNIHVEEVGGQAVIGRDESGHQSIRHGDLKPENILRFLNSQTKDSNSLCSIGNLKIADLGLAKRHVVATEYRAQKTSTMYGTALYEAPEAAQSLEKKARSRLYDVWSMGCIMFEFVLWMLHGNELVTQLHDRLKKESNQYFELPTGMAGTARVHKTVTQWMQYLQENDPDCGENTAIGDLLRLIKTKLLVVNLPPGGHSGGNGQLVPTRPFQPPPPGEDKTNYRCTAEGLLNALDNISHKMNDDSRYTLSGESRHNIKPPSTIPEASDEANSSLRIPGTSGQASLIPQVRGVVVNREITRTAKADYTLPPLEDWEYPVDNDFAGKAVDQLETSTLRPLLPHSQLCSRCSNLNFWKGGFAIEDKIEDLYGRSQACLFCQMLWNAHRKFGLPKTQKVRFERHESTLKLSGTEYTLPTFSILRSPKLYTPLPIQIGFPQLPQPRTNIFFSLLRLWLQDCDDDHKGCETPKPACLPTRSTGNDILLSRTHGATKKKHPPFSTLKRDPSGQGRGVEELKKAIPFDQLPTTFRDAVITTRALNIRYLWIDSLCIIQGEDGDFSEESKRMEDVFSCAYCVLAASRATGQHDGFLQPINQREYITFPGTAGNPFYVCENIDDFSGDVLEGSLNTRGWVLQERALARRTIFFTERQTYFECGKGVRCQSLTNMHNNMSDFLGDPNFPKKAISVQRGLRIRYFQDLYKQYSRLNFTHIEDRPFAIEGLENRLRTAYETGGAYGIFDDGLGKGLFHRSLLWQRGEDEPAPGLLRIVFPSGRKVAVPTWSWMAYRGGIDYVDPPFDQTIWEKEDIHPPRIKSNTSSLHGHDRMELLAAVRWFNAPDDQDKELKLVYDTGENKLGDMRLPCVVVAKSKEGQTSQEKKCYVLLVAPLDTPVDGGYHIYERVGAGVMPGRFISFDEPSQQVKIR